MVEQKYTRISLIQYVAEQLDEAQLYYGHGTDNAWDEAAWLVLTSLGLPVDQSLSEPETFVQQSDIEKSLLLLKHRIATRKPLAYLINSAWFAGQEFYVDERVIVPRSPIAELIHSEFKPWLLQRPATILDLCTGSGCIAIACALAFEDATVHATDIDDGALSVAQINVDRYHLGERVILQKADVFYGLSDQKYDLIVTNPPYVDSEDMGQLPQEYHAEPRLALASGQDGLDIVRRIIQHAAHYLHPGGLLVCEVGNSKPALLAAYPKLPFVWLDFQQGGSGVFILNEADLHEE